MRRVVSIPRRCPPALIRRRGAPRRRFPIPEQLRLRAHFARALRIVGGRDASQLSPELQTARARNLDLLRTYRARGIFPRNVHFAVRMPYFVDPGGRACAVAHLALADGRTGVVDAVVRVENNAYIHEMTSAELLRWVGTSGFDLDELAIIQPDYCGEFACLVVTGGPDPLNPEAPCTYAPADCDDLNACTLDSCEEPEGCRNTPVACAEGYECSADACDPAEECVEEPVCVETPGCAIGGATTAAPWLLFVVAACAFRRRRRRGSRVAGA